MRIDHISAMGLIALALGKAKRGHRPASPPPSHGFFMSKDGRTVYYVDKKGTRRKATEGEREKFLEMQAASEDGGER
jgi:hypothetical protein